MRQLSYILFLSTILLFGACQKGPTVDIPFRAYVVIPPGLNTGLSHHFALRDIPGVNYILKDAQPAYVTLSIEYGETSVDFIQQAYLYTWKDSVKQEMAYQTSLPFSNYSSVQLYPSILNMVEHITQDKFDMQLKLIFRAFPVTETRIRVDFGVQGELKG